MIRKFKMKEMSACIDLSLKLGHPRWALNTAMVQKRLSFLKALPSKLNSQILSKSDRLSSDFRSHCLRPVRLAKKEHNIYDSRISSLQRNNRNFRNVPSQTNVQKPTCWPSTQLSQEWVFLSKEKLRKNSYINSVWQWIMISSFL